MNQKTRLALKFVCYMAIYLVILFACLKIVDLAVSFKDVVLTAGTFAISLMVFAVFCILLALAYYVGCEIGGTVKDALKKEVVEP